MDTHADAERQHLPEQVDSPSCFPPTLLHMRESLGELSVFFEPYLFQYGPSRSANELYDIIVRSGKVGLIMQAAEIELSSEKCAELLEQLLLPQLTAKYPEESYKNAILLCLQGVPLAELLAAVIDENMFLSLCQYVQAAYSDSLPFGAADNSFMPQSQRYSDGYPPDIGGNFNNRFDHSGPSRYGPYKPPADPMRFNPDPTGAYSSIRQNHSGMGMHDEGDAPYPADSAVYRGRGGGHRIENDFSSRPAPARSMAEPSAPGPAAGGYSTDNSRTFGSGASPAPVIGPPVIMHNIHHLRSNAPPTPPVQPSLPLEKGLAAVPEGKGDSTATGATHGRYNHVGTALTRGKGTPPVPNGQSSAEPLNSRVTPQNKFQQSTETARLPPQIANSSQYPRILMPHYFHHIPATQRFLQPANPPHAGNGSSLPADALHSHHSNHTHRGQGGAENTNSNSKDEPNLFQFVEKNPTIKHVSSDEANFTSVQTRGRGRGGPPHPLHPSSPNTRPPATQSEDENAANPSGAAPTKAHHRGQGRDREYQNKTGAGGYANNNNKQSEDGESTERGGMGSGRAGKRNTRAFGRGKGRGAYRAETDGSEPCRFHIEGRCRFGGDCRHPHVNSS